LKAADCVDNEGEEEVDFDRDSRSLKVKDVIKGLLSWQRKEVVIRSWLSWRAMILRDLWYKYPLPPTSDIFWIF